MMTIQRESSRRRAVISTNTGRTSSSKYIYICVCVHVSYSMRSSVLSLLVDVIYMQLLIIEAQQLDFLSIISVGMPRHLPPPSSASVRVSTRATQRCTRRSTSWTTSLSAWRRRSWQGMWRWILRWRRPCESPRSDSNSTRPFGI